MKYIYHYHAVSPKGASHILHIDGIIIRPLPILTMSDYTSVKKAIIKQMDLNCDEGSLCIESLSLLHTE